MLQFEEFQFDPERFQLTHKGAVVPCEPKVLDLIAFMAANPDRVLTKDEIVEQVWDGRFVSDATISGAIKGARKALGDTGKDQRFIRTVHGRGFRFVAAVDAPSKVPPRTPVRVYSQPLLIVPSPTTQPGESGLAALGEDLSDRLRTALGRVPFMSIMSRRAANAYDPETSTASGYLLDIRLSGVGDTVRASIELTETGSDALVWSRSITVPRSDTALDALVDEILPRLEPALVGANYAKLKADPNETDARPLVVEALSVLSLKGWHAQSFSEAEALIRKSMGLDHNLPMTRAILALVLALGQRVGFFAESPDRKAEALAHAEAAMALAPRESLILGLSGCAIADAGDAPRALPILKQAIELNPDNAHAHAAIGAAYLQLGQADKAVTSLTHGIAISPHDNRLSIWLAMLALAHLKAGNMDEALAAARRGAENDDKTYLSRIALTGVLIARGDMEDAAIALADCRRVKPDMNARDVQLLIGPSLSDAVTALMAENNATVD